jgi:glycine cleavage system H protein
MVASGLKRKSPRKKGGFMTVILVLFTFATFLLIDHFHSRKAVVIQPAIAVAKAERPVAVRAVPDLVAGFKVPENLRYHPGHTWALSESPSLVRVGLDDFASKLMGKVDRLALPQRGQWIRQGQKIATFFRNGVSVDLVSPIEGSISDVNDSVARDPKLAQSDCYGEGWLVTVQSPDAKTNFRNLLSGVVARFWTQESASRLQSRMPAFAGALAQDGGVAVDNLADQIPDAQWASVSKEFFLS